MLSPFECLCGNFILPEPASYVFFYAFSNLRKLLYIIMKRQRAEISSNVISHIKSAHPIEMWRSNKLGIKEKISRGNFPRLIFSCPVPSGLPHRSHCVPMNMNPCSFKTLLWQATPFWIFPFGADFIVFLFLLDYRLLQDAQGSAVDFYLSTRIRSMSLVIICGFALNHLIIIYFSYFNQFLPQQFLNLRPLPHGHGLFRSRPFIFGGSG